MAEQTQTSLSGIEELKRKVESAQSEGKFFQLAKGVSVVEYTIDGKPQVRISKFGKEQMLINVFGIDGTNFPDGPKEWWVSINSPLALSLVNKVDSKLNGTAKIMRSGDGEKTRYELLE